MPFATIVGHRHVVGLLRQAAAAGRVPQSLLFAGPDGVGKRTMALALAQALNCPRRSEGDGCGRCPTCQRIAGGRHSDVVLVDRGEYASIRIDVLRERVHAVVGYRPFEAERRVFIIDPADDLGSEAQASLLKTLEEPPAAAIIVLVTAFPDSLLATVQSRCRRLRFGPLSEADVARVLEERCGLDRAKARLRAAASGGSVARALAEEAGDLAEDRATALGLLTAAAEGPGVRGRLKAAAALVKHSSDRRAREALGTRLAVLASLVRDLFVLEAGDPDTLANADLATELRGVAASFDPARLSAGFSLLTRAQADLERSASPKIVADWVALTI